MGEEMRGKHDLEEQKSFESHFLTDKSGTMVSSPWSRTEVG